MSEENAMRRIFDGWATGDFGAGLTDLDLRGLRSSTSLPPSPSRQ